MTHEKEDLRVRRTQKMLQEALIDLISERSLESISVSDIAERAMVNRATFYRHYHDKDALMEKIFAGVVEQMVARIGQPGRPVTLRDASDPPAHWVKLFEHIGQNHRLYEAMLGPRGNPALVARLREQIMVIGRERLGARERVRAKHNVASQSTARVDVPVDFVTVCVANTLLGAITWWLDTGRVYTPEQMATWISRFTVQGYLYAMVNPDVHLIE